MDINPIDANARTGAEKWEEIKGIDGISKNWNKSSKNIYPKELKNPDINVFDLPDEMLQSAIDTIYQETINRLSKGGKKKLFQGGPRQTITITSEGKVIVTQNNSAVDMAGRLVAYKIFGDKAILVPGGKDDVLPNMPDKFGGHAEAKGVNYLIQHNMPIENSKQYSSHYSCPSCEQVQQNYKINNRTGCVSEKGKQTRDINPFGGKR